ncbi:MAG: FAD-dependent oxidoreductase, partial [Planctomycetota bacterium]
YICHCGTNIAAKVDTDAARAFAETLPGVVVARDYKFMCSDPGQELIQQDIQEQNLNRIVVASCSPLLHEATFQNACAEAGLSPFQFQMANIREHVSWVTRDQQLALEKSKALIAGAVRRVSRASPLEKKRLPVHGDVLVVGGGIAGIHAALTLAEAGRRVYLVEREPTIGGHMAKFDKTFPTLDCSACILTPKMSAVKNHPNITLWSYSEVESVSGFAGNFTVTVRRKPRYINEDLCVGCAECVEACVFKKAKVQLDDEFNLGLSKRKPVYMPFPQATPAAVVIDPDSCLQVVKGKCAQTCVEACDRDAIDFDQQEQHLEVEVGAILLTTGFKTFDPNRMPEYGYGRYPNVYTSLEVERLVNAAGPSGGEIVLRDGTTPKSVAIIHCVGSRDRKHNAYCSKVCCMYSLKLAHLVKERTDAEVFNFYIDMRTARHPRRGHPRGCPPTNPRGHGHPGRRPRTAGGCRGRPAPVQHLLLQGRLVHGAASEARAGRHLHRRRVAPEGHPRDRGPGGRSGSRSAGIAGPRLRRDRARLGLDRCRRVQRLQDVHPDVPLLRHQP